MDYKNILLLSLLLIAQLQDISCQHEDIPYEDVPDICDRCLCLKAQDENGKFHHVLGCSAKNFKHILARWPAEFGTKHDGVELEVTFSGNKIPLLQQLPATNGTVSFSCRHCSIKDIQAPTFMDVPNIIRLDLSWNDINGDVLTPDVFRGPYNNTAYEPIGLQDLNLSHNKISDLDGKMFEHTPKLVKLNLGYNNFRNLTTTTVTAIVSASQLEHLDLSYNQLTDLSQRLLKALINLKELHIQGNRLKAIPADLGLIGRSLEVLDISGNEFRTLNDASFLGLKVLKELNISAILTLKTIENDTFTRLESLEFLTCRDNAKLTKFDLEGLIHSPNLTELDISGNSLDTIVFNIAPPITEHNSTTAIWRKLRKFHIAQNPWNCNCGFFKTIGQFNATLFSIADQTVRCEAPYALAGARVFNLTTDYVCTLKYGKYRIPDDDPPRFLRPRYIAMTIITIAVVIAIGTIIGFAIVIIRRKLKREDFGVSPIRYTTVRNSTASVIR